MAVVNDDIIRATLSLVSARTQIHQNVFHYKYTGSGDTDDEVGDEITAALDAAYTTIEASLDSGVVSTELDAWLWDAVLKQFDGIYSEPIITIIGSQAGVSLPDGAAALVRLFTNKPRRQGRKFIGGMSEEGYADTGWAPAQLVALALFISAIVSAVITLNGTLTPGTFNLVTESFEPFKNAGSINTFCAYQRRRRPGVGI